MSKTVIHNPIIKGFNSDPSNLRIDDDYYIATNTFEWHPGIQVYHSRDLAHWELNHFYLRVTYLEGKGTVLGIILRDDGDYNELTDSQTGIADVEEIYLRTEIDVKRLQYYYSMDGQTWQTAGPVLDMTKLSDDYTDRLRFTGTMVGLCVQDLQGDDILIILRQTLRCNQLLVCRIN